MRIWTFSITCSKGCMDVEIEARTLKDAYAVLHKNYSGITSIYLHNNARYVR